jgi:uncharacterized membrane protein YagU involved in acid resistance
MMNPYLAGAIGGMLAAAPMTLVMEVQFRRLTRSQRYPLPPRELTEAMERRAGVVDALSEQTRVVSSLAAHFAYGALTGAAYPLFAGRRVGHPALHGSMYGVFVWAASYLGWVPAAGILAPATEHPAQRRRLMIVAHLVWGAVMALIMRRLDSMNGAAQSRKQARLVLQLPLRLMSASAVYG